MITLSIPLFRRNVHYFAEHGVIIVHLDAKIKSFRVTIVKISEIVETIVSIDFLI